MQDAEVLEVIARKLVIIVRAVVIAEDRVAMRKGMRSRNAFRNDFHEREADGDLELLLADMDEDIFLFIHELVSEAVGFLGAECDDRKRRGHLSRDMDDAIRPDAAVFVSATDSLACDMCQRVDVDDAAVDLVVVETNIE